MYKLKPVLNVPAALDVHIACPMYKLKNLHKAIDVADQGLNDVQLSDEEINVLLKKQNEVISTLEQLELRLNKLDVTFSNKKESSAPVLKRQFISSSQYQAANKKFKNKSEPKKTDNNSGIAHLVKNDTVIFADPEDPPYSVLALPILWPEISWDISYHVHSTLSKDVKELEHIKLFKNVSCNENKNIVKVFVIWQQTKPSPRVVTSPTNVLLGEVSLLRLFNQHLAADQTNLDKVLNVINEISCSTSDCTSELNNLINDSNTKLDIANIALWSLLYKKNNGSPKTKKWTEQLTKLIIS